jgi:hypothetical protein
MIIEIEGIGRVQVDDEFADLTPEQQNAQIQKIALEFSQQQKEKELVEETSKEKTEDELSVLEHVKGTARSFAQGLTFGFADELEAGTLGKILDYDVDDIRKSLEEFREEAPVASFASEIGGALLPSLAAGLVTGGTGTAAGLTATAARATPSLGRTIAKTSAIGAGYGGLYGAGTAEGGIGERAVGAGTGALVGAVTGGAVPAITTGATAGARRLADILSVGGTKRSIEFSDEKLLQALQRDGLSPKEASKKLAEARLLGSENVLIADLGENLRGLSYVSQAVPNESRQKVAKKLAQRNIEQAEIIADDLAIRSKLEGPFSVQYIDDLAAAQQKAANPGYKEAYQKALPAKAFKDFFTGPRKELMSAAAKDGKRIAAANNVTIPDLGKLLKDENQIKEFMKSKIPTEYLHSMKIGLDSIIDRNTDKITGKVTKYGTSVINAKNQFNEIIGKLNPAYAKTNKQFSDYARLLQAYHVGHGFKNKPTSDLNKFLSKFNEGEKEAFRTGMISSIKDRAESLTSTRNFIPEIFGSKKKQNQLRLAFPGGKEGEKAFADFKKIIELEEQKVLTKNRVFGNSATAKNIRELEESGADVGQAVDLMARLARGEVLGAAGQVISGVGARVGGMTPERANLIAQRLFTSNPAEQQAILNRLQGVEKDLVEQALKRISRQQTTSALISGQVGGLVAQ